MAHLEDQSSNSALLAEGLELYGIQGLMVSQNFSLQHLVYSVIFCVGAQVPCSSSHPMPPQGGCSGNSHGLNLSWGVYAQHGNFPFQSCSSVFLGLGCRAGVLGRCQQQLIYCPKELNTRRKIPQLSWPPVLWSNLPSVLCRFSFLLPAVLLWKPP